LKQLREGSDKTIREVADAKVFSTSKVIRIEGGKIEVKPGDVWTLCRFYGINDGAVIDSLAVLAEGTGERGWWEGYGTSIRDWFALYLGLEEGADEILIWDPELIHGLLQTADYASWVNRVATAAEDADEYSALRMARQQRFFDRDPAAKLTAVLGAGALARQVGGAAVMDEQIQHLRQLNARDAVNIRVLRWDAGAHPAMSGGFTAFDFTSPDDPPAAYLETIVGGTYLEQADQLARYREAFTKLYQQSTPVEEYRP
jgi:hypothetical protein